jgi:mitochondrial fission protein ELM1
MSKPSCWIITEGAAGMESQCRGLAEALGLEPVYKRVNPRLPWLMLPANHWPCPFRSLGRDSDRLAPPWPDIVIACGRKSVPFTLAIKRASRGATFTVYIQDPQIDTTAFDLVAAPHHDRVKGPNVIQTRGALHPVSQAKLAAAAEHFRSYFPPLPRPQVAVLVGGPNRRYRLAPEDMAGIADALAALARRYGAGLLVTPSRRTGKDNEAVLRRHLEGVPAFIWDGTGENPYLGMLALADYILVTADSVSMVTEACATGKPVYVIELMGRSRRHGRFHDDLSTDGITRPFTGTLETWSYEPIYDAARVADEVRRLLARHGAAKMPPEPARNRL